MAIEKAVNGALYRILCNIGCARSAENHHGKRVMAARQVLRPHRGG